MPLFHLSWWHLQANSIVVKRSDCLPLDTVSDLSCLATFKRLVKTELYNRAYLRWLVTTRNCDSSLCEWLNVRHQPRNNNNNWTLNSFIRSLQSQSELYSVKWPLEEALQWLNPDIASKGQMFQSAIFSYYYLESIKCYSAPVTVNLNQTSSASVQWKARL